MADVALKVNLALVQFLKHRCTDRPRKLEVRSSHSSSQFTCLAFSGSKDVVFYVIQTKYHGKSYFNLNQNNAKRQKLLVLSLPRLRAEHNLRDII